VHTRLILAVTLAVTGIACAATSSNAGRAPADRGANDASAPSEIAGVVVDVEAQGLGDVTSFELRSQGESYEIFIDPQATYSFPPSHLSDHLASSEPVRVGITERNGRLYASSIEDA
jgi:hypothetical protein